MRSPCLWWRHFFLMLWKNAILQARSPLRSVLELVLPAIVVTVFIIIRIKEYRNDELCLSSYGSYSVDRRTFPNAFVIYYSPNTSAVNDVMSRVRELELFSDDQLNFTGFSSEEEIVDKFATNHLAFKDGFSADSTVFAGVVFPANLHYDDEDISVTIRETHEVGAGHSWKTARQRPDRASLRPQNSELYYYKGFLYIQSAISLALIQWKIENSAVSAPTPPVPNIGMRRMPFPKYTLDTFLEYNATYLPLCLILAYMFSAGIFTKELVLEKESRLRESMKMMGLKSSALFSAWFVKQFLFMMLGSLLFSTVLKVGIFTKSEFSVILAFVTAFTISLVGFGFFMSSLFSSAKSSLYKAFIVWYVLLCPFVVMSSRYHQLPFSAIVVSCLFSNSCAGYALRVFVVRELQDDGVTWGNAFQPLTTEDPFHLGVVFGMLLLDTVLYLVFAWYKEAVFPGKYGVPKPFYFPFLPSYWLGRPLRKRIASDHYNDIELQDSETLLSRQDTTEGVKPTITIEKLTKVYKSCCRKQKLAVDDLSLNMYEGQITALLGHNGAGKTTTMSVLTGLYTPTSGDAVINGYSILTDMDEIRKSLGLCPQHNVLFDRLTVKEHLMLFGMLKGMKGKPLQHDVKCMIADLQLEDKTNVAVKKLSGGMKRKLSVAIALIGGSQFVILDEPTSGMDPYARRSTWDLLAKYKKNRTILLTTHHMDEADILGDRIAIMAEGKLLTSGTPLFLKSCFGVGYHLTVVKGRNYDSNAISDLVTSTVEGSEKSGDVAGELSFVLPSNHIHQYPALFDKLEADKESLGIASYGVSATTIEEVFLRIMKDVERGHFDESVQAPCAHNGEGASLCNVRMCENNRRLQLVSPSPTNEDTPLISPSPVNSLDDLGGRRTPPIPSRNFALNTGVRLWVQQFWAMVVKRALNTFRHFSIIVSQLILPMVVSIIGIASLKSTSIYVDDPPRPLTLKESSPYTGIKMFYGDFGDVRAHQLLESLDPSLLQVSSLLNITQDVYNIQQEVIAHNDSSLCCDYTQQLLDNYCLSIDTNTYFDELRNCSSNKKFAYRSCPFCLDPTYIDTATICRFHRPKPTDPPGYGPVDDIDTYVDEYLLRLGDGNIQEYVRHYQLGFTVGKDGFNGASMFTVWYNNQNYHTCPSALSSFYNMYMNFLLRVYNVSTKDTSTITFINHPLPRTQEGLVTPLKVRVSVSSIHTTLSFAFSILISSFVLFIVQEKTSKAKHLQFVTGVRSSSYWMANVTWDFAICTANVVAVCVLTAVFQIEEFKGDNLLSLFLLMLLLCWAGLPLIYCISHLFNCHLFAFAFCVIALSGNSLMMYLTAAVGFQDPHTADILDNIFFTHPCYSFSKGVYRIYRNSAFKNLCTTNSTSVNSECKKDNIEFVDTVFTMDKAGIGQCIVALAGVGAVLWIVFLVIVNSKNVFAKLKCSQVKSVSSEAEQDEDVVEEKARVQTMDTLNCRDLLTISKLTKVYEGCPKQVFRKCKSAGLPAVNDVSVGVEVECFGLLGNNGAGKTTTFKILTGDLKPTNGTAFIAGEDIRRNLKRAQQHLGYCPQFDALLERMTGEELLTMFCRLRGIPEKRIPFVVKTEIKRLDLEKYAKKRCGTYSGGNKRKLSVALSLVGGPTILLLDEPTTGMDPKSRRKVWEVLSSAVSCGRSVVLSSHSMEECEALCTRLAIMVNGEFKCLGSVQHLKSKFGRGYTVTICTKSSLAQNANTSESYAGIEAGNEDEDDCLMLNLFHSPSDEGSSFLSLDSFTQAVENILGVRAITSESHSGYATINLPSDGLPWSAIFSKLEEHKEYLGIENYSVSQTTLEQMFLGIVNYQQLQDM